MVDQSHCSSFHSHQLFSSFSFVLWNFPAEQRKYNLYKRITFLWLSFFWLIMKGMTNEHKSGVFYPCPRGPLGLLLFLWAGGSVHSLVHSVHLVLQVEVLWDWTGSFWCLWATPGSLKAAGIYRHRGHVTPHPLFILPSFVTGWLWNYYSGTSGSRWTQQDNFCSGFRMKLFLTWLEQMFQNLHFSIEIMLFQTSCQRH